jgi:hypothetical protein
MKVKLWIRKRATLYEAVHAISDAESFGRASADVWVQMRNRRLQKVASIGAPMEVLNGSRSSTAPRLPREGVKGRGKDAGLGVAGVLVSGS